MVSRELGGRRLDSPIKHALDYDRGSGNDELLIFDTLRLAAGFFIFLRDN